MSAPLPDQLRARIDKAKAAHTAIVEAAHKAAQGAVDARDAAQGVTQETPPAGSGG